MHELFMKLAVVLQMDKHIILIIIMLHSTEPSNSPAVPSLQPALEGRLILDYQQLEFGPDNATLRWQYFPDPSAPCTDTRYRVELSKFEDITNAQFENELEPFQVIESARKSFSLPVNFVNVEENYFRVSAIDASNSTCARMEYYTALLDNGKIYRTTHVYTSSQGGENAWFQKVAQKVA